MKAIRTVWHCAQLLSDGTSFSTLLLDEDGLDALLAELGIGWAAPRKLFTPS